MIIIFRQEVVNKPENPKIDNKKPKEKEELKENKGKQSKSKRKPPYVIIKIILSTSIELPRKRSL